LCTAHLDLLQLYWDNRGEAFKSGTAITMVQLVVPGSATRTTAFDYCFLGLTVQ
jgi:hypothetical protein